MKAVKSEIYLLIILFIPFLKISQCKTWHVEMQKKLISTACCVGRTAARSLFPIPIIKYRDWKFYFYSHKMTKFLYFTYFKVKENSHHHKKNIYV